MRTRASLEPVHGGHPPHRVHVSARSVAPTPSTISIAVGSMNGAVAAAINATPHNAGSTPHFGRRPLRSSHSAYGRQRQVLGRQKQEPFMPLALCMPHSAGSTGLRRNLICEGQFASWTGQTDSVEDGQLTKRVDEAVVSALRAAESTCTEKSIAARVGRSAFDVGYSDELLEHAPRDNDILLY
jgi:hypothetical protein